MCRLFSMTSKDPVSPMQSIIALDAMREGHDGSGVGLYLTDLAGPFENLKDCPILSGIFTRSGLKRLNRFMDELGFQAKHRVTQTLPGTPPKGTPTREVYLVQAYSIPEEWKELSPLELELRTLDVRLQLKRMGIEENDMTVFSFWPDTIMIKEIGDPMKVGEYLNLDHTDLHARLVMAQGRQNTNYAINLYACHPFFIQGLCTMTNGENTAFVPIRDYLKGLGVPGYEGYHSDSEVFAHILHFAIKRLGLPVEAYKHIITPLKDREIAEHPDADFLHNLKQLTRKMIIDGPNCVIGCLPDKSMFMVQDAKKLRPGIVGGKPGVFAFSSEVCGIDAVIPDRDTSKDFQPMHLDTAIVSADRQEITICRQTDQLPPQR
ncbi:MAG: glutamate synthase [Desulfovibrio sp.]